MLSQLSISSSPVSEFGCNNEFPGDAVTEYHTLDGWKQQKRIDLLPVLEPGSLESRCEQGWLLLQALREDPVPFSPQPLLAVHHLWCCLACRWPQFLPPWSHLIVSILMSSLPFLMQSYWMRAHRNDLILIHLGRPFQIRSHSRITGLRLHYILWEMQPTTLTNYTNSLTLPGRSRLWQLLCAIRLLGGGLTGQAGVLGTWTVLYAP